MANNKYCIDLAKRGTASCKNCKQKIEKGLVRIAKVVPNPFTEAGGDMKNWHHVRCIFQALSRARATTKKIDGPEDLEGWEDIEDDQKEEVLKCIAEFSVSGKKDKTPQKKAKKSSDDNTPISTQKKTTPSSKVQAKKSSSPLASKRDLGKDDSFREFRRLCANIAEISSYNEKTAIMSEFFKKGSSGKKFDGDLYLYVKTLLPAVEKRVYNVQSRQLIKLFSQIFGADQDDMLTDLEQGDVAETVRIFFEESEECPPHKKSSLTLQDVDQCLEELSGFTKEEQQLLLLKRFTKRCTGNDLKMFVRLIKHDLRINAGPKHVLGALHPTAFQAFQASRDLKAVVDRFLEHKDSDDLGKKLLVGASPMTPVLPMLAKPCRTVEQAFQSCPNGLFVEIKYDGERVQLHKQGDDFTYFSRSLKPVMPHKVLHFKDYIPKAFPFGNDLIIDCEILLVDNDGKPLPFGTLGAHKKQAFQDATVCLFIFDCLHFNEKSLMNTPLDERREILAENMKEVKNHIMMSEQKYITEPDELRKMIRSVIKQGLEGLMIKDKKSIYEPGKRHWLKVKKDYLDKGAMADSADLVVLGAYFGTGNKGGMKSIFLMGCYDDSTKKWCTVTKVHGGHTDEVLEELQNTLKMTKISKDHSKVPKWMNVDKSLVPDFVITDTKDLKVWQITGAEFTNAGKHTAAGISIRFPRVSCVRDDKEAKDATSLKELKKLFAASKVKTDLIGLASSQSDSDLETEDVETKELPKKSSPKGRKRSRSKDGSSSSAAKGPSPKNRSRSRSSSSSPARKKSSSKGKNGSRRSSSPAKKVSEGSSRSRSSSPATKKLSNVFTGIRLFLPPSTDDFKTLRRYFIAFDGILLQENDKESATHLVASNESDGNSRSAVRVTVDWLWDCIKLQRLLPHELYRPV